MMTGSMEAAGSMPVKWQVNDDAEQQAWDGFVLTAPGGEINQSTAWARIKHSLGLKSIRIIAWRDDRIAGGAQLTIKRFGRWGAVGYIAGGPLIGSRCLIDMGALLAKCEDIAKKNGVDHMIVQPSVERQQITDALRQSGYRPAKTDIGMTATCRLDLTRSREGIRAGIRRSKRKDLKQSIGQGVNVRMGTADDIDVFHKAHKASANRHRFHAVSIDYLRRQWDVLAGHNMVQLVLAEYEGELISGKWVTTFGDSVTARFAGSHRVQPAIKGDVGCDWGIIQWAKIAGYRYYDFGGVSRRWAEHILQNRRPSEEMIRSRDWCKFRFGAMPILLPTPWQVTFGRMKKAMFDYLCEPALQHSLGNRLLKSWRTGSPIFGA